jgi:hypothetical protein
MAEISLKGTFISASAQPGYIRCSGGGGRSKLGSQACSQAGSEEGTLTFCDGSPKGEACAACAEIENISSHTISSQTCF